MFRRPITCLMIVALLAGACSATTDVAEPDPVDGSSPPAATSLPGSGQVEITAPPPPPIIPVLRASAGSGASVGIPVSLVVNLFAGEPVQAIELLVNGVTVDRVDYQPPATNPTHVFDWTPEAPGGNVAEVVAISASGAVADASPTWFQVADGDAGVAAGTGALPSLDTPSDGVAVDVGSCEAEIAVTAARDAGGLIIKGATSGSSRFIALGVLPPEGGTVSVPMTAAPILVRADSYTADAVTGSTAFIVPGNEACGGAWTGDLRLEDGVLIDVENVELAYLYAATGGIDWHRLPADQGEFVERGAVGFDFSSELARIIEPDGDLEIEGWGWSNGELVDLGRGSFRHRETVVSPWNATPLVLPSELTIEQERQSPNLTPGQTEIFEAVNATLCLGDPFVGGCVREPALFHWERLHKVEAGFLQISRLPFPAGTNVDPVGLLYGEMIPVDESTDLFIPLDVRDLAGLGTRPMESLEFEYSLLEAMQADLSVVPNPAPTGLRRSEVIFRGSDLGRTFGPPSRLYVRIVHFVDGRPTAATSNTVEIVVDRSNIEVVPSSLGSANLDIEVDIDLPRPGNPEFEHCLRVIANPFGAENPVSGVFSGATSAQFNRSFRDAARTYTADGVFARGLEPGATVCARAPKPPDKDFIDYVSDIVSFGASAWSLFVDVWEMLKAEIVKGVVFVTGCEPKDVCTSVASAMLDTGLAALGVPPTIPRFSDLVQIAKGELIEVATTALIKDHCPEGLTEECQDILNETLTWVLDQIQEQATAVAVNKARADKYLLALNPEIDVVSEPAGQMSFGFADVTITRPANTVGAVYSLCDVTFEVYGTALADWKAADGTNYYEVVTKRVVGPETITLDPNTMLPGESVSLGLLPTDFDRTTHMTGAGSFGLKSQYDALEAWRHVWQSGTGTVEAHVDVCGTRFTNSGTGFGPFPTPELYETPSPI